MSKLGDLALPALTSQAKERGVRYRTGPFIVRLQSGVQDFLETVSTCYASTELFSDDEPCHFHVSVDGVGGLRRRYRPQVQFTVDGMRPFEPYPLDHAFPMYEWGLNWCIGSTAHQYLMLHSAVLEREGRGLILPAIPGSGKSTLCAGLVARGWRLLSDEFGLIRHSDGMILPLPRAAPLKNESIDIISSFDPELALGPRFDNTRKGTVAHMLPPKSSLLRQTEPAYARWVVFPSYRAAEKTALTRQHPAQAFTRLVNNSFNYPVTMAAGFRTLTNLVRGIDCYQLTNGDLGEAIAVVEDLLEGDLH